MDDLYSIILSRIADTSIWIKEILLWFIFYGNEMNEKELEAAVQASLGDEHDDWALLLESSCGSIL